MSDLPIYRNSNESIESRVKDLLDRMNIDEKIAQLRNLVCPWDDFTHKSKGEIVITDKMKAAICDYGYGALQCLLRTDFWSQKDLSTGFNRAEGAELVNRIQKLAVEKTRLGIPLLLMDDARHGQQGIGTTMFPAGIALGSTWNKELLHRIGNVVGRELRRGGQTVSIGPHLNVTRDPRWSRMEETYGEDPFLVGQLGASYVKGLQAETPDGLVRAVAAMIMFGGMGSAENGQDARCIHAGKRELHEVLLRPFEAAVKAGTLGAMASYCAIDGVPCHANRELLTDILRNEWGFRGFIESDCHGLIYLNAWHNVACNLSQAAAMGVKAGLDLDLHLETQDVYGEPLKKALDEGRVSIEDIDILVSRLLSVKFRLGLFENPFADPDESVAVGNCPEHQAISLDAARQCMILLKNDNNTLPLKRDIKSVAVIGPNADDPGNQMGDYTPPIPREKVATLLDGVRACVSEDTHIHYARGCGIKDPSTAGFKEALSAAEKSDVAIVAIGGSSKREYSHSASEVGTGIINETIQMSDIDCGEGNDRISLDLPEQQLALVQEIKKLGIPIVVVLIHGRPISIPEIDDIADAIVDAWYPGPQGGQAVAEVIFGEYNPAGRLPISIPRHVGQLPVFYNTHRPPRHDCVDMTSKPLYQFGYGLSYTRFEYSNLTLRNDKIKVGETATVSVDVTNTGKIPGDEVVQMYIKDYFSSLVRPELELKGFERIHLAAGQTKRVPFAITEEHLCFYDIQKGWIVEPGDFTIMIGGHIGECLETQLTVE